MHVLYYIGESECATSLKKEKRKKKRVMVCIQWKSKDFSKE